MSKKRLIVIFSAALALAVVALIVLTLTGRIFAQPAMAGVDRTEELQRMFSDKSLATITLDGDYWISRPIVVTDSKEIAGKGTIRMAEDAAVPEGAEAFVSGEIAKYGCTSLEALNAKTQLNMFSVAPDAVLTLAGEVCLDGNQVANGVYVSEKGTLKIAENAEIKNTYYCNVYSDGAIETTGGRLSETPGNNVVSNGKMDIRGGVLTGAKEGAVVFSAGELTMSGGQVGPSVTHGIYAEEGSRFLCTGGEIKGAKMDNVHICEGAEAEITGGTLSGSLQHSVDNAGTVKIGAIAITDAGLINNNGAVMELTGTRISENDSHALCNNGGKMSGTDITVKNSFNYAVLNTADAVTELHGMTIDVTAEHAIGNSAGCTFTGSDIRITNVGRDKCGVRNYGTMRLTGLSIKDATHSLYNEGTLDVEDSEVIDSKSNAVYNVGGTMTIKNMKAAGVGQYGISNAKGGMVDIRGSVLSNVGKNGLHNVGTAHAEDLTLETVGEYGISNPSGSTLTGTDIRIVHPGKGKSGIHDRGEIDLKNVTIDRADTAIYVGGPDKGAPKNDGKVNIQNLTITNASNNAVQNNGGNVSLTDVTVQNAAGYGITSSGTLTLRNADLSNIGRTGIYNSGNMNVAGLRLNIVKEYGISNPETGKLTGSDVSISYVGADKSAIHCKGELTLNTLSVDGAAHAIYNEGKVSGSKFDLRNLKQNGIYNQGGTVDVSNMKIYDADGYGIANSGNAKITGTTVSNVGKSGVSNSGTMSVAGLRIDGVKEYGITNPQTGKLTGSNVSISYVGADKSAIHCKGELALNTLSVDGAAHAIYNEGKVSGSKFDLHNLKQNGIYNQGGTVDVSNMKIYDADGYGIANSGDAKIVNADIRDIGKSGINNSGTMNMNGLTLDATGEYGISNPVGGKLKGLNISISHIPADKSAIHNRGELDMTDLSIVGAAHGIYNEGKITGNQFSVYDTVQNGIHNVGGTITLSDFKAFGAGNCGISNAGIMVVKNADIQKTTGTAVYNTKSLTIDGLAIDTTGQYGISNRLTGQFSGAHVTIENVADDKNCIHNLGTMKIEDVTLDGAANGFYNENASVNAADLVIRNSSNNGIMNNQGKFTVRGLTVDTAGNNAVNNSGTFVGKGTVILKNTGSSALHNAGTIADSDDIVIENVQGNGHGVYNFGTGKIVAKSLSIRQAAGNGIYNYGASVTVSGKLTIHDVNGYGISNAIAEGTHAGSLTAGKVEIYGIGMDGVHSRGSLTADEMTVRNAARYGFNAGGTTRIAGDLTIQNTVGHAIVGEVANASLTAGNIYIDTVTGAFTDSANNNYDGIRLNNATAGTTIKTDGVLEIKNVAKGNGIRNAVNSAAGTAAVAAGELRITAASGAARSVGAYGVINTGTIQAESILIDKPANSGIYNYINGNGVGVLEAGNITVKDTGSAIDGVTNASKITLTGTLTVENAKVGLNNSAAASELTAGVIRISNVGNWSISNVGSLKAGHIEVCDNGITNQAGGVIDVRAVAGVQMADGKILVSRAKGHGINNAASADSKIMAGAITINGYALAGSGSGIQNGANAVINVSGPIEVCNETAAGSFGISNLGHSQMTAGSIRVVNAVTNGINQRGTLTVSDDVEIDTAGGHGIALDAENAGTVDIGGGLLIKNAGLYGVYLQKRNTKVSVGGDLSIFNSAGHAIMLEASETKLTAGSAHINTVTGLENNNNNGIRINKTLADGTTPITNAVVEVTGMLEIKNIAVGKATGHGISIMAPTGKLTAGTIAIVPGEDDAKSVGGSGVYNLVGTIEAGTLAMKNVTATGITTSSGGKLNVSDLVEVNGAGTGYGISSLAGSVMSAGSIRIADTENAGINLRGTLTVNGDLSIDKVRKAYNGLNIDQATGDVTIKGTARFTNIGGSYGLSVGKAGPKLTFGTKVETDKLLHMGSVTFRNTAESKVELVWLPSFVEVASAIRGTAGNIANIADAFYIADPAWKCSKNGNALDIVPLS